MLLFVNISKYHSKSHHCFCCIYSNTIRDKDRGSFFWPTRHYFAILLARICFAQNFVVTYNRNRINALLHINNIF